MTFSGISDFALERYFAQWEFSVRYNLCASDIEGYALAELLELADDECRSLWATLRLGYTESTGHPLLRREIAALYEAEQIAPEHVLTFAGAEEGIFVSMHALLRPGDHAVVAWPAYQSLHDVARAAGADVTLVPLDPVDWSLDPDAVRAALRPNTRVIVINFPHSPTGALASAEVAAALVRLAEEHGAFLFSDEVYRLLEFDAAQRLPPAAVVSARGISLGVTSKAFATPGLRIGWVATQDREILRRMVALKDYTTICNSAPSEILALIALRARDRVLARSRAILSENLALLDAFFARHQRWFRWTRPRAGSVGFPELVSGNIDHFAAKLVEREGVLLLPGSQFGYPGRHFRIGFGRRDMPEAIARCEAFALGEFGP